MIRITGLKMALDAPESNLQKYAAQMLHLPTDKLTTLRISKKALDARDKKRLFWVYTLDVAIKANEDTLIRRLHSPQIKIETEHLYQSPTSISHCKLRPLIVGLGPAGIFAGLILATAGLNPLIIERGLSVAERVPDVENFWQNGILKTNSNVQFGQGGAGTFADGKLTTGIKDERISYVLGEMVAAGAPQEIIYLSKPHIGTDKLRLVVENLCDKIITLGGEIRYDSLLNGIQTQNGTVQAVKILAGGVKEYSLDTDKIILAIGHSARDTFRLLQGTGIIMTPKPFSVGVRIEHKREEIDRLQYGEWAGRPELGAADYKIACHLPAGRGIYTFCMCPGGQVVAAATEKGGVVTNGMSYHARDGENSNSAVLVSVEPGDFPGNDPLSGIELQRQIEQAAFIAGGGCYQAPAQLVGDFLAGKVSSGWAGIKPTYKPAVKPSSLDFCLPPFITSSLRLGLPILAKKLRAFANPEAIMTAAETRSSSPVRIPRGTDYQSNLRGLFPCGEGGGHAGGIISAAVDGIRTAEAVIANYQENL